MIKNNIQNYEGVCEIGGRRYVFKQAEVTDAAEIAALYNSIKIDFSNCRSRLDPADENNFENKGGMFIVPSKRELEEEMLEEYNFRAVFKDGEGHIAGSFWFSESNEAYNGSEYGSMENAAYPREILVSPRYASKHIAKVMYYTVIKAVRDIGYTRGAADLYKVVAYETPDFCRNVSMINIPSMRCVLDIGAVFAAQLPRKTILLDKLNVTVEPQLYLFDFDAVISRCEALFKEKNIKINWSKKYDKHTE